MSAVNLTTATIEATSQGGIAHSSCKCNGIHKRIHCIWQQGLFLFMEPKDELEGRFCPTEWELCAKCAGRVAENLCKLNGRTIYDLTA